MDCLDNKIWGELPNEIKSNVDGGKLVLDSTTAKMVQTISNNIGNALIILKSGATFNKGVDNYVLAIQANKELSNAKTTIKSLIAKTRRDNPSQQIKNYVSGVITSFNNRIAQVEATIKTIKK